MDDTTDDYYLNFNLNDLFRDQFYLNLIQDPADDYVVQTVSKDCYKCQITHWSQTTEQTYHDRYNTRDNIYITKYLNNEIICDLSNQDFQQFGVYNVTVNNIKGCEVKTAYDPVNIYWPLLSVSAIYILLVAIIYGFIKLYDHSSKSKKETDDVAPKKERVKSLDTFRGIAIAIMIFVNYGAGGYYFFEHAPWNGLHLADLAFPWFMWIMGACIPISLTGSFKRKTPKKEIIKSVLIRSIKLFCIGIYLNNGPNWRYVRFPGVLQRFGVIYFIVCSICILTMSQIEDDNNKSVISNQLIDFYRLWRGWIVCTVIFGVYLIIIFVASESGCPSGYFGPGGLHEYGKYFDCVGGVTGSIDRWIFRTHMYQEPTSLSVYQSEPGVAFDPEGSLGCLTTIIQVFLGVQAGMIILTYKTHNARLIRLFSWAVLCGIIGGCLCEFSKEDGLIPVNKNLWSASFVFVTSCFAFLMLGVCYFLVDATKWWNGKPFLFAGMNAILLYIGHDISTGHFPVQWQYYSNVVRDTRRTHFWCLIYDFWGTGFWIYVSYCLYRIKYFFTI